MGISRIDPHALFIVNIVYKLVAMIVNAMAIVDFHHDGLRITIRYAGCQGVKVFGGMQNHDSNADCFWFGSDVYHLSMMIGTYLWIRHKKQF